MTIALAVAAVAAIGASAFLDASRCRPSDAAVLLLARLAFGAALVLGAALAMLLYLPGTSLLAAISHWCLHLAIPAISGSFGVDGHEVGALALLGPTLVLLGSVLWVLRRTWRGARALRRDLLRAALHEGPDRTLVVAGDAPIVATAGFFGPRVILSSETLLKLDDGELAAALAHERAHIARRHRFVLLLARVLYSLAWPLPGTRAAIAALEFQLERDADEWAAATTGDRIALATAICKVAVPRHSSAAVVALGGGDVAGRLRLLANPPSPGRASTAIARASAVVAVVSALGFAAQLPGAFGAGLSELAGMHAAHPERCDVQL